MLLDEESTIYKQQSYTVEHVKIYLCTEFTESGLSQSIKNIMAKQSIVYVYQ
jgi:hypothetical protein